MCTVFLIHVDTLLLTADTLMERDWGGDEILEGLRSTRLSAFTASLQKSKVSPRHTRRALPSAPSSQRWHGPREG